MKDGDLLGESEPTADMRQLDGHADDEADDDGEADEDEAEEEEEDDDDAGRFLLDEDSDAPNLIPEEHPRGILAGRIEMLDKIGEGGMGTVWRGHHLKLDRAVAVKVLDESLQLRTDGRERFIREGKALALLDHRNVVRIYDCDQLPDGKLFLCMELLEGDTLRALIKSGVRPDPLEVIDIGLQICDAIEAAHKRGILHRDLTPSNVMRLGDPAKTIKVIDWGLCKYLDLFYMRAPQKYGAPPGSRLVTPLGCRFGTPEYMAPEMILRENPGPPSFCTDVYALGVVLYELLTGKHPFAFGDRKRPRPIDTFLPGFDYNDLETALRDAVCFDPEERTPNMAEMREALDMARECLLAQRATPTPSRPNHVAVAPALAPPAVLSDHVVLAPALAPPAVPAALSDHVVRALAFAPPAIPAALSEPVADSSMAGPADVAASWPATAPAAQARPRGRLVVLLALLVGVGVGAGGMLVAQRLGGADVPPADVSLMAREMHPASAAELPADRCQADMARGPAELPGPQTQPAASTPPSTTTETATPPSVPTPGRGAGEGSVRTRPAVLAAMTGSARRSGPSSRPAPAAQTFQQAMARLEPKIAGCAREADMPESPVTVQVRRKGGVLDMVKVVRLSKVHPFAICVDKIIRQAPLPASDGSVEDFTFFR